MNEIFLLNIILIFIYSLVYNSVLEGEYSYHKNNLRLFLVSLVTLQLVLILALRHYSVGADTANYISIFEKINSGSVVYDNYEYGYLLLQVIVSFITSNAHVFLAIVALLSIVPVGYFIFKYSKMPFLSFIIYIALNFYAFTFSGLRQSIAYGIIFISYNFIKNRKFTKFFITVLIASSFHISALVFLPAYFLYRIKVNKKTVISLILFDIVIFIFRKPIFSFLIDIFYSEYEVVESVTFNWLLFCTSIIILGGFAYREVINVSEDNNGLFMLLLVGVSIMLFSTVGTSVNRISNYYYMFVIIFIPEVISSLKSSQLKLLVGYSAIMLLMMVYFIYFFDGGSNQIVPYKFFWQ